MGRKVGRQTILLFSASTEWGTPSRDLSKALEDPGLQRRSKSPARTHTTRIMRTRRIRRPSRPFGNGRRAEFSETLKILKPSVPEGTSARIFWISNLLGLNEFNAFLTPSSSRSVVIRILGVFLAFLAAGRQRGLNTWSSSSVSFATL